MSCDDRKAPTTAGNEIEITPEMVGVGVEAYFAWDYNEEDVEALVAEVFFRMSLLR